MTSCIDGGFRARTIGLTATLLCSSVVMVGAVALLLHPWTDREAAQIVSLAVPNYALTPGAIVAIDRIQVCRQTTAKNKQVSEALRRQVFAEYGIPSAHPEAYEVDYLITPALGGADDIHNLWPESKRTAAWNALVKDALEDHLRDLVCQGQLDPGNAQRQIAGNWIDAYKKYFQTDSPRSDPR